MGKRIIAQRRGKGNSTYRTPKHRYKGNARTKIIMSKDVHFAKVVGFEHSPAHSAPLACIEYDDGERGFILAPEGIAVGDIITIGNNKELKLGNTMKLSEIPEGTFVYNIEKVFGDGGKFVRASGTGAKVLARVGDGNIRKHKISKNPQKA